MIMVIDMIIAYRYTATSMKFQDFSNTCRFGAEEWSSASGGRREVNIYTFRPRHSTFLENLDFQGQRRSREIRTLPRNRLPEPGFGRNLVPRAKVGMPAAPVGPMLGERMRAPNVAGKLFAPFPGK